jgi:hypothetical protein
MGSVYGKEPQDLTASSTASAAFTCPAHHIMIDVSLEQLSRSFPFYQTGFICEECGRHYQYCATIIVNHCEYCNYDICSKCASTNEGRSGHIVTNQPFAKK